MARYDGRSGACVPVRMPRQMYRCSRLEAKELSIRPAEDSRPPRTTVALQERWFPSKPPTGAGNTDCVDYSYFSNWCLSCHLYWCNTDLPSDAGAGGLTTEHGGGVDQTVDPGCGGVILLKVQLELHKEHGHTSGYRDMGRRVDLVHFYTFNSLQNSINVYLIIFA